MATLTDKMGQDIALASTYGSATYTSNTWLDAVWTFNPSAHPTLDPVASPGYAVSPISFSEFDLMRGADITSAESDTSSHYIGNTWSSSVWNFGVGVKPTLIPATAPTYTTSPIDYSVWTINEGLMNGAQIALADTYGSAHYTGNTWLATVWDFVAGERPKIKPFTPGVYTISPIDYSDWAQTPTSKDGSPTITLAQAKKQATYAGNTWQFGDTWAIKEDVTFPRLLARSEIVFGDPLTSSHWVVFVAPSDFGTMYYENEIYGTLKKSILIQKTTGVKDQLVTYSYNGEKYPDTTGKMYSFIGSGIQDPAKVGGFGSYTRETTRTVPLLVDRSNNINFYYNEIVTPTYDYLLRIATTDLLFHIVAFIDDVSSIRVVMADGVVATLGLVAVGDPEASPIRVMTPTGIMALQFAEPPTV